MPTERRVQALLGFLILFDAVLTTCAFVFPELWFQIFHGTPYADPQGYFRRAGASWAAFLLLQVVAVNRWKRDAVWLAIIAGVRLSDIFTDVSNVFLAHDTTWFAKLTLVPTSICNLLFGVFLLRAYRWRIQSVASARTDSLRRAPT